MYNILHPLFVRNIISHYYKNIIIIELFIISYFYIKLVSYIKFCLLTGFETSLLPT